MVDTHVGGCMLSSSKTGFSSAGDAVGTILAAWPCQHRSYRDYQRMVLGSGDVVAGSFHQRVVIFPVQLYTG